MTPSGMNTAGRRFYIFRRKSTDTNITKHYEFILSKYKRSNADKNDKLIQTQKDKCSYNFIFLFIQEIRNRKYIYRINKF